jgi:ribosomal protein S7
MSCQKFCNFDDDARSIVERFVNAFRREGHKNEAAIHYAADLLAVSPRTVWSLKYRQPVRITHELYQSLLARWWAYQARRAAELRREADLIDERSRHEQSIALGQLTLDFGGPHVASTQSATVSVAARNGDATRG